MGGASASFLSERLTARFQGGEYFLLRARFRDEHLTPMLLRRQPEKEAIMRKRKTGAVGVIAALLAVTFLAAVPPTADGKVITVVPEKFKVSDPTASVLKHPGYITTGPALKDTFWAPLNLPAGATIRKLRIYSWGAGAQNTTVALLRTKVNQPFSFNDLLMSVTDTAFRALDQSPTVTATIVPSFPLSDLVIRKGYRYFLFGSAKNGGFLNGAKVFYR